jgi:anthranilate phosphoribosyltransferase
MGEARLSLQNVAVRVDVPSEWFREILPALVDRQDLHQAQVRRLLGELIQGRCNELEAAAVLVAWRMKGETAAELAAAALVLREQMVRFETGRADLLDTCGTGGDGSCTFNISTAAALVSAAAGVSVVKHGNRAVSSSSGSADVLAALGVTVREGADWAQRCLNQVGLAFCFAPHFHPAMRHVAALRRRLPMRTLFNCLGPLLNPAGAAYRLLGVGRREMLDPMAGALARLGVRRAFLVCGVDGLDEVSLSGSTLVREVRGSKIEAHEWLPHDFRLKPCRLTELTVTDAADSARVIREVLSGQDGPAARIVAANAAAALLVADRVATLTEGVECATEVLRSGRAAEVLERLIACSVN